MSRILIEPSFRPQESGRDVGGLSHPAYPVAVAAALLTLFAVALFFLLRYPVRGFRYPVGWDAPWYVWRANAVAYDGLVRIGTVRAATPLILSMLERATGQNAFTMVALAPPLFAGVAGLAVAAMIRSAFATKVIWVPVFGFMAWVAFGGNGLLSGYTDETLNVSFTLAGFACAVALVAGGRGALATTLMFMAAGLAEWPFYGFAMLIFGLCLVMVAASALLHGRGESLRAVWGLTGAIVASGGFILLTLVGVPAIRGFRIETLGGSPIERLRRRLSPKPALAGMLKRRFLEEVKNPTSYLALGLAGLGCFAAARGPAEPGRREARRFFLALMLAWILVTIGAAIGQLNDLPLAGARLLLYFFAAPILLAVLVWVVARVLINRLPRGFGRAAACVLVIGAVGALASGAWRGDERQAWVDESAIRQLAAAGIYLTKNAPDRNLIIPLDGAGGTTIQRWRHTVRAGLPAQVVPHFLGGPIGSPLEYLDSISSGGRGSSRSRGGSRNPLVIVIEAYNKPGFEEAHRAYPENFVSPGVLALNGPVIRNLIPEQPAATANTTLPSLLWLVPMIAVILLAVGGGWSVALLPSDPVVRAALSPALGLGVASLMAVAWDRLSLGLQGWWGVAPLVATAISGWSLAWFLASRPRKRSDRSPARGPATDGAAASGPPPGGSLSR